MKNLRTISLGLLLVMILSMLSVLPVFASQQVSVIVNNQTVTFPDAQPFIDENSRTLVPVRFVSEALGADVTWNQDEQAVGITKDDIVIELKIGSEYIDVNYQTHIMDTVPVIISDRTFVPLRFVSEYLNCDVEWIQETYTVNITDLVIPYSKEAFDVGNDLDTTEIKEVVSFEELDINIEEGDSYTTDEKGYLTINKHSGLTIKYLTLEEYKKVAKEGAANVIITIDRNKDMTEQLKDLSDDSVFEYITVWGSQEIRYGIELFISRSWKNGVQGREFTIPSNTGVFEFVDGENNTIIFNCYETLSTEYYE